jgi:hypothetical protein
MVFLDTDGKPTVFKELTEDATPAVPINSEFVVNQNGTLRQQQTLPVVED